MSKLVLSGLFCLTLFSSLAQNITWKGIVRSGDSPVAFAVLYVEEAEMALVADSNGYFSCPLNVGVFHVQANAVGFESLKLKVDLQGDLIMDVELVPQQQITDEVVVTGQIAPALSRNTPLKVDVYSRRFLQSVPSNSVIDALHYVSGLQQVVACGVCGTNDIHINGMEGPYTLVLIDGMPIMSSLASVYALNGIPNSMVEQVEVIKGPSSTVYGTSAVGGVINILTMRPEKANKLDIRLNSGTYNDHNLDIGSAFGKEKNQFLVSANLFDYRSHVDQNKDGFTDLPLASRMSLFAKWQHIGRWDHSNAVRLFVEDRFGGEMDWQIEHLGGNVKYGEHIETRRLEMTGMDRSKSRTWLHEYSFSNHYKQSYYGVFNFQALQQNAFSNFSYFFGKGRHKLRAGFTQRLENYRDNTPVGADRLEYVPGVFLLDNIEWNESWGMMSGLRVDHHNDHGVVVAPQLHIKWKVSDIWEARLNTGRGFRTVNIFTEDHAVLTGAREVRIGKALKPESSWNVTGIITRRFVAGKRAYGQMDFDAFWNEMENKILPDYDQDPNAIVYKNLEGHSISRGLSMAVSLFLDQNTWFKAGGNVLEVFERSNADDPAGSRIRQLFVPAWSALVVAGWKYKPWSLSLDYSVKCLGPMFLPEYPIPFQRPTKSEVFALHNFQVTKQCGKQWTVGVQIKNLFDYVQDSPLIDPQHPFGDAFDTSYAFGPMQHRSFYITAGFNIPQ